MLRAEHLSLSCSPSLCVRHHSDRSPRQLTPQPHLLPFSLLEISHFGSFGIKSVTLYGGVESMTNKPSSNMTAGHMISFCLMLPASPLHLQGVLRKSEI